MAQAFFLPVGEWLTLDSGRFGDPRFSNPFNGVTYAFLFAVPLGLLASATGGGWLPEASGGGFGTGDGVLLSLLVAPLSEVTALPPAPAPLSTRAAPRPAIIVAIAALGSTPNCFKSISYTRKRIS